MSEVLCDPFPQVLVAGVNVVERRAIRIGEHFVGNQKDPGGLA